MQLETINKLFLELSQVATAKTERELLLEDLLVSARCIAQRKGEDTAWEVFDRRLASVGIGCVTWRVFKVPVFFVDPQGNHVR
jgi:hypothetical protein